MKLLTKQLCLIAAFAAVLSIVPSRADAQLVDIFGGSQGNYTTDYLVTIANVGGTPLAVDPTTDPDFGLTGWTEKNYNTGTVNGTVVDTGAAQNIQWRSVTNSGAIGYGSTWPGGIIAFRNLEDAHDILSPLNIGEDEIDGQKYTQYFRIDFNTSQAVETLGFEAVVDDGAVFYIDGQEVARLNCCNSGFSRTDPDAAIGDPPAFVSTTAGNSAGIESAYGRVFADLSGFGGTLPAGSHTLSMSVHSSATPNWTSNDMGVHIRRAFLSPEANQWTSTGSGTWDAPDPDDSSLPLNWLLFAPEEPGQIANFLGKITRDSTVHVSNEISIGTVNFDSSRTYAIAGLGTVVFNSGSADAAINVERGTHEFQVVTELASNLNIDVASGATLEFNNTLEQAGKTITTTGSGTVMFNNLVTGAPAAPIAAAAGIIGGSGVIDGALHNQGAIVAPGNSPGTLTIAGDYTQDSQGSLEIEIAGTLEGIEHDVLVVQGMASFDGALDVVLLDDGNGNEYTPAVGDQYSILDLGDVTGEFASVNLPSLDEGLAWDTSELYSLGNLSVVPEPSSSVLLILGGLLMAGRRRRRS